MAFTPLRQSGIRDRKPLLLLADRSGLPAAAAFAAGYPPEETPDFRFVCVGCEPEPWFDERFRLADPAQIPEMLSGSFSLFVCGTTPFCRRIQGMGNGLFIRQCATGEVRRAVPEETVYTCTILRGNEQTDVKCFADRTLLYAFEKAGVPVRTGCRIGECGYCRCRLISGETTSQFDSGADLRRTADAAKGFIHPCRTFPDGDLTVKF